MQKSVIISTLLSTMLLEGCATYNFAPPNVEMAQVTEEGSALNTQCKLHPSDQAIDQNIDGAGHLIDNFLFSYRCAARQVANGRQHFEVPAMAIAIGGAAALAAGAPAAVAIGTGAATAGLNGFKGYYAPKDKLPILTASVDALVCIKNRSVGVDAYGSSVLDKVAPALSAQHATAIAAANTGTAVAIEAVTQYYDMIQTALLTVENVAAQRLSSIGSYSPDAIVTEFKAIEQKQKDADAAAKDPEKTSQATDAGKAAAEAAAAPTTLTDAKQAATETKTVTAEGQTAQVEVLPQTTDKVTLFETQQLITPKMLAQLKLPGNVLSNLGDKPVVVAAKNAQQGPVKAKQDIAKDSAAASKTLVYISKLQPQLDECVLRAKL